jgi:hypothetical protein
MVDRTRKVKYIQGSETLENFMAHNKVIYSYIRNGNGHPIGLIVAIGKKKVGWSKLHKKDAGKWCKEDAISIAIRRALKKWGRGKTGVPQDRKFRKPYFEMIERSERYYKKGYTPGAPKAKTPSPPPSTASAVVTK